MALIIKIIIFNLLFLLKLINLDLEFIRVIIELVEYYWVYDINHLIFKNHYYRVLFFPFSLFYVFVFFFIIKINQNQNQYEKTT